MNSIKEQLNFYLPMLLVEGVESFPCYRCRYYALIFTAQGGVYCRICEYSYPAEIYLNAFIKTHRSLAEQGECPPL